MKKRILQVITTFAIVLGLVVMTNANKVFAKEENIMNVSELQVGDFIPAGTVLITEKTYVSVYGGIHEPTNIKLKFYISKEEYDKNSYNSEHQEIYINKNSSKVIDNYSTIFRDEGKYDGWVLADISHYAFSEVNDFEYSLIPANKSNRVVQTPSEENNYLTEYQCPTSEEKNYTWYKRKMEINKYSISNLAAEKTTWTAENGMYELLDTTTTEAIEEARLSFEFTAEKGDIVMFEIRGSDKIPEWWELEADSAEYEVLLNGTVQKLPQISDASYTNIKLKVEKTGEQKLDIVYRREMVDGYYNSSQNHISIKNVNLLSKVNEGNKLDTTKVTSGDTVYHECACRDGYLYKSSFKYVNNKEVQEATKNPTTTNDLIKIITLVTIFGTIILTVGAKNFKGKKNSENQ